MQRVTGLLLVAAAALLVSDLAGGQPVAAGGAIAVPEGDGAPVITDGLFSAGEWDDARAVALAEDVTLLVKEYRGVVFIGVRGRGQAGIGPSELLLATPGGAIHKMHVSAQLYEAELPAFGEAPPPRFGFTTDWYANEIRRDMELSRRMQKEGKSPIEIMRASAYPSDGLEFAVRRAKLPGSRWLMRLSASAVVAGRPGMLTYPPATAERDTGGWLELRLR